jgi:hypothetical protein
LVEARGEGGSRVGVAQEQAEYSGGSPAWCRNPHAAELEHSR